MIKDTPKVRAANLSEARGAPAASASSRAGLPSASGAHAGRRAAAAATGVWKAEVKFDER